MTENVKSKIKDLRLFNYMDYVNTSVTCKHLQPSRRKCCNSSEQLRASLMVKTSNESSQLGGAQLTWQITHVAILISHVDLFLFPT